MSDVTVNIPQLLAIVVVGFLALRWFFFNTESSSTAPGTAAAQARSRGRRVDERNVEQILQMFPQMGRREVFWDLMRNGGSVAATSERILSGRALEIPPTSFQPPPAPGSSAPTRSTPATPKTPQHPDLITRYNLSSKVSTPGSEEEGSSTPGSGKSTWSPNKSERHALMLKKREEMILRARRKLEEKDALGTGS